MIEALQRKRFIQSRPFSDVKCKLTDLWQCFQNTNGYRRCPPYATEGFGGEKKNLSRGFYSLAQLSSATSLPLCRLSEAASQSRRPSLIIDDGLPLSRAVPSSPRLHCWMPAPRAGEAHLALQPWLEGLGPCLAWIPTLYKPTLSALHSSTPCTCVCVCVWGAQLMTCLS